MIAPAETTAPSDPGASQGIDGTEILVLGSVLLVASVSTWSLALAQVGRHDGLMAAGLGVITTAVLGSLAWRAGRARAAWSWRSAAAVAGLGVLALVMFLPGAPYAMADKDPGVYVSHGFAIARTGDVTIPSPVLERVEGVETFSPGAVFPGIWVDEDDPAAVTPQFFHLYPALLGTTIDLVGSPGAWHLNPLLGALSVVALALAVRRAAGELPAALTGVLLCLSMPQVWQAKYPSTEILAQLLLSGAVLGVAVAARSGWAGAGAVAGVAVGTGFLARPDGVLYVMLAIALLAGWYAAGRWDRRCGWFAAGLVVPLPYAVWNAFGLRSGYTLANGVPPLSRLVAVVAALGLAAVVARRALRGRALTLRPQAQRRLGAVGSAAAAAVLLLAWFRRDLLGIDHTYFGTERIRSFDEENLRWLSFFFTVPGLVAMWGGLAVVLLRRWRAALLLVVIPGLAFLPLYLWEAKISPRMMWWVRRYVPGVVPVVVVLIAVFLAWAILHRRRSLQVAGALLALYLGVAWAQQSLPLRSHREMAGSYTVSEEIASAAGGQDAIFLFARPRSVWDPNRNFPGPVWLVQDQLTALLPEDAGPSDVEVYRKAFPELPILLVTSGGEPLPPRLDGLGFEPVHRYRTVLPMWDESVEERPDHVEGVGVEIEVWALPAT